MKSRAKYLLAPLFHYALPSGELTWTQGMNDWSEIFNVPVGYENIQGDWVHPNPSTFTHQIQQSCTGTVLLEGSYTGPNGPVWEALESFTGCLGFIPPLYDVNLSSLTDPAAYNGAVSSMYEQLRGNIDLSIDLGTLSQTARMIEKVTSAVHRTIRLDPRALASWRNAYHDLTSSRRPHRSRRQLRALADNYLEYQYGWKLLVEEAYDVVKRLMAPERTIFVSSGKGKSKDVSLHHELVRYGSTGLAVAQVRRTRTERVEVTAMFVISPSVLTALAGYTSLNPISIVWELIPFSFVVDWFVDVGGYIRNVENACIYGSDFDHGYVTRSVRVQTKVDSYANITSPDVRTFANLSQGSNVHIWKERQVLLSAPFPEVPRVHPSLGSGRLLNAAALLGQFIKRVPA